MRYEIEARACVTKLTRVNVRCFFPHSTHGAGRHTQRLGANIATGVNRLRVNRLLPNPDLEHPRIERRPVGLLFLCLFGVLASWGACYETEASFPVDATAILKWDRDVREPSQHTTAAADTT